MINVTKSFLPDLSEYTSILQQTWQNHHLTNRGPLVQQLEKNIREKLGLNNVLFVSNGTIAIQLVLKAFNLSGEILTTPFSYVATTNSVLWENMTPVFCDIDPNTFCLDAGKLEALITPKTTAILATHVYGLPCDTERIAAIAEKHGLKVIYDAAHAFGVNYKGQSLLNYGDASTCSFHATKLFHTVEGGSITTKNSDVMKQISLYHSFGHIGDDYYSQGINGKNSEFHAAMGLCNLPKLDMLIEARKTRSELYDSLLSTGGKVTRPVVPEETEYNYAYYPVVFESEAILLKVRETLLKHEVNTRRYFYPSLNRLPFLNTTQPCPVSEDISSRVLCLPMYYDLETEHIERICKLINTI
ncbi:MAG: DegT/DnrJ/EryC1/StrS family aminotransferase [Sediminibacterium sp.]|nr:DegT/DnrJ/EryC1/StrS family aminotransferase [Sediminibacterium sp.]